MNTTGFIYAVLAAVLWGLVYTIDQKVLKGVSPLALLFVSALLMAFITLPMLLLIEGQQPLKTLLNSGRFNLGLIFFASILAALASFCIFSGIKILGASTASVFEIAYPVFVVLFCFLFFGEMLSAYFYLGAIFIFIGSLIIVKFA